MLIAVSLALSAAIAAAHAIASPENVTVDCHNLENFAYWNYSQPSHLPRFMVYVCGYSSGPILVESCNYTRHYFCNVSAETRNIDEHFYINVTALLGTGVSLPADSAPFSYSTFYDGQCKLDFPKTTLSVDQDYITITFLHPLHEYTKLHNIRNIDDYSVFKFDVITKDKLMSFRCDAEEEGPCTARIPVDGEERHCLWLKGSMNGVTVSLEEEQCVPEHRDTNWAYSIVVTVTAIAVLVILLVFAILMYKKLTSANSSFPKTMASVFTHPSPSTSTLIVKREDTVPPESVSSLTITDEHLKDLENAPLTRNVSDTNCSRFKIGLGQADVPEGSQGNEGVGEENEPSGYDRPKLPIELHSQVEMSPGDIATGYRI